MEQSFYAYPSVPAEIGITIEKAVEEINKSGSKITSWTAMDIIGNFIPDEIFDNIQDRVFIGDITRLNFNVVYEFGYAIGAGRKILITKNNSMEEQAPTVQEVGIFDTLGFAGYGNSDDLKTVIQRAKPHSPLKDTPLNNSSPVYILESKHKTDFSTRIAARVKKARLSYRSFDPSETPRLSAFEAITNVAQSHGVIVTLLNRNDKDNKAHNIRAAFIAGLAAGMNKVRLILQYGSDQSPIDVRDFVQVYNRVNEIDPHIGDFAMTVVESMQQKIDISRRIQVNTLEKIDLGASAAENEMRTLKYYYLKTDAFHKAVRGEAQLVVGRKGSGKTAVFLQIRDSERNKNDNLVLDLKPDGYKLIKFKEQVLDFLEEGTFQHTIMAFWEYILLLEICHKTLEVDKKYRFGNPELGKIYRELEEFYTAQDYLTEGDFSERMSFLMSSLQNNFLSKYSTESKVRLSVPEITQLLYDTDIKKLKEVLTRYLVAKRKGRLWLLFDNIDKGWPASGLKHEDLIIIRTLIDATRKIQTHFDRQHINVLPIIFLRNDVYELLVGESPDRQKEAKVLLDWTDPDLLREIIKLRLLSNQEIDNAEFDIIWRRICVSHYCGEDSFQFLIERSLMRPRFLLNLINHCRSIAVNLNHNKIFEDDIKKGLEAYSADLLTDIKFEISDVFPEANNILFGFIDSQCELSSEALYTIVEHQLAEKSQAPKAISLLLWYGFLGIKYGNDVKYIYNTNYSIDVLNALIQKQANNLIYVINPGFYPSLLISE